MGLRVGHVGTGTTGKEALRAILTDPELELVTLYVNSPEKEGVDAGRLCGLPDVAVKAARDLQPRPDGRVLEMGSSRAGARSPNNERAASGEQPPLLTHATGVG